MLCACGGGGTGSNSPSHIEQSPRPIMSAAMKSALIADDPKALIACLDAGENPNSIDETERWSALRWAVRNPEGKCARVLIEHGADVNLVDEDGTVALSTAASFGYLDSVRLLLENGAEVSKKGVNGFTPLGMAVGLDQVEAARILIKHGASPLEDSYKGETPLHMAASDSFENEEMLTLLIDAVPQGAMIDKQDSLGHTPLLKAIFWGNELAARQLLEGGSDLKYVVSKPEMLVRSLGTFKDIEIIKRVVAAGFPVDTTDYQGHTALHIAAANASLGALRIFLELGAAVNPQSRDGNTPLHLAAMGDRASDELKAEFIECVKLLLAAGADRTIENDDRLTPIRVSIWAEVDELLQPDSE